jgi:hypothetical protein
MLNFQLEKWCRIVKRIIQFFRFIKIPIIRSRFIDTISRRSTDHFEIEGLNGYATTKIQEDLLFLDDIKRLVIKFMMKVKTSYFRFIVIKKYSIHYHHLVLFGKIKNFD